MVYIGTESCLAQYIHVCTQGVDARMINAHYYYHIKTEDGNKEQKLILLMHKTINTLYKTV